MTYCCRIGSLICSPSQIMYLHLFMILTFIRIKGFREQKSVAVQTKIIPQRGHFPASPRPLPGAAFLTSSSNTKSLLNSLSDIGFWLSVRLLHVGLRVLSHTLSCNCFIKFTQSAVSALNSPWGLKKKKISNQHTTFKYRVPTYL